MDSFASFVQVKPTLSDGRPIQWKLVPSGKQIKVKIWLDGAKGKLQAVPKKTLDQQGFSLDVVERWLDEKFVVAAAEDEGVVAAAEDEGVVDLLPTAPSPFRSKARRRREREQFGHSPGHQEAMEVRSHKTNVYNGRRRNIGELDGGRVDLSGRWNDFEEELEDEDGEWEDEDDELEDEAPVDAENATKCTYPKGLLLLTTERRSTRVRAPRRRVRRERTATNGRGPTLARLAPCLLQHRHDSPLQLPHDACHLENPTTGELVPARRDRRGRHARRPRLPALPIIE
jgi:hypothetical protein